MAQPPDLVPEALAPAMEGRSLILARRLSLIFNPVFVTLAAYLLVGWNAPDGPTAGLAWSGLIILVQALPTIAFYLIRLRQGAFSDPDVSVRHERNELYTFGALTVLLTIALLLAIGAPYPFVTLSVAMLALGMVCGLVNLFWKISMHGAAIGALATLAMLWSSTLGVSLWIIALAVGWARVRTRNHTPLQVVAGLAVATTIVVVTFRL